MNRLLSAGRELIKGDFNTALKSLSPIDISPSTYRELPTGESFFIEKNGTSYFHFKYYGHPSSLTAYERCPPVNAIINQKAQAFINGKTWVLNTRGKESITPEAKKIKALIDKPNPLQNRKQFEAQGYIYQQLFGFNIILPIKPAGFTDNIDAYQLWNIPPSMVDIEETNKLFYQTDMKGIIKQIVLNYKGTRTTLNVSDIFIVKDFTPSFHSLIVPNSRICALELPINNIIGAYESRNMLINYRGALGILTQDPGSGQFVSMAMTETEKERLQDDMRRYGLKGNQWQYVLTSATLKWQQMGYPTKDLMLFEEIEGSTMAVCDGYGYPYRLMSQEKSASYNDVREFEKKLYQDTIVPEAENYYEQVNQMFGTDDMNIVIDKDFAHISVLQEDQLQAAQARKARNDALLIEYQNDLITMNRWLELNGEDTRPDGNVYYSEIKRTQNEGQENQTQDTEGDS